MLTDGRIPVDLGAGAWLLVIALGTLFGIGSMAGFRRWTDAAKLREATNRMLAHLMELRLFADEPKLILRAQLDLLIANAALLRQLMKPLLLLAIPSVLVLAIADSCFREAPLRVGETTVVTAHVSGFKTAKLAVPVNKDVDIEIETPPVHIERLQEISWRIRPRGAMKGNLEITWNAGSATKAIRAGSGFHGLSFPWPSMPFSPHPKITIQSPPATILGVHWLFWFTLAAALSGLGFAFL